MIDRAPSSTPLHAVDATDEDRYIALAVRREELGLGEGEPLWLVIHANKTTGVVESSIRSTLPSMFVPR
jgi:hypothetical protein